MAGDVEELIEMSELDVAESCSPMHPFTHSKMAVEDACIYTTTIPTELAGNFPEGSVLQIMPDAKKENCFALQNDSSLNLLDGKSEENMDMDLSFLSGITSPSLSLLPNNNLLTKSVPEHSDENVVMIDVSRPIQLSQNSLIVVDGQKCVLQHDVRTGQVVAYPVKEPGGKKRRGRPRKTVAPSVEEEEQQTLQPTTLATTEDKDAAEEEREKGLLQVVNDDGALVRRSSRKRKKAKVLRDYETGNLKQELGSDVEDVETADHDKKRVRGPGRPRKSESDSTKNGGGAKSSTKEEEPSQAFLVQTADGQALMMQVPLSSIPLGISLEEMAQEIANKLNLGLSQASDTSKVTVSELALQVHSVGSTTTLKDQGMPQSEETTPPEDIVLPNKLAFDPLTDHDFFAMDRKEDVQDQTSKEEPTENETMSQPSEAVVSSSTSDKELSTAKQCKICQVPCLNEEELIEHFKLCHPRCVCAECGYVNEHPYVVKRHSFRHLSNGACVCRICNKKYKDVYILRMHMKMVHLPPEVLYACEVCEKQFTRKAHLKRHLRIHASTRHFQCPHCEYRGCEKSDITKHLLIHEAPKFKCEMCGKAFRHLKNKELHLKRHSGQRDYKCAACGFFGYTYTDIRKHIERRHSVPCPHCKQIFMDTQLLKEHKSMCEKGVSPTIAVVSEEPALLQDILDPAPMSECSSILGIQSGIMEDEGNTVSGQMVFSDKPAFQVQVG